jgi:uncharacterized protein YqjF (DUF2071 family)
MMEAMTDREPAPGPVRRRADDPTPSPICPQPVDRACMIMRWDNLTFLHWRFEAEVVQRLIPAPLAVETFDGSAWVGLVPFEMQVRLPHVPAVPWLSNFPETNVRTYVRAPDGTVGVWFLSLDAARASAVVTARSTYRLPYFWSKMAATTVGPLVSYRCRRRWPGPVGASSEVAVEVGEPFAPDGLDDLDHWLTARWRLFSVSPHGQRFALADHPPWLLHRAELLHVDDELVAASGLPRPTTAPLVHWSPGVEVRVGFPHRLT